MARELKAYRDDQRVLVLSLRCNNHCRFCFYSLDDRRGRDDPDLREIAGRLASWREEGVETVNLHGGEPTVAPTFRRTIALIRRLDMRYVLSSNVRAFAVERFASRVLAEAPPHEVLTTLLSWDADTHDGLTRSLGSHGQTVAGIRRLRDAGIPTNVHVVILRQNYRELPTLVDHLIGLGCTLKFSFPVFSGGARHNAADIACRVSEAIPHLQEAVARLEATQTDYFVAKAQVCAWPERFAHVIQQVSDISDHRHFPCCDGCHYRERCDGISATYAALYGTDEFRAISGPVPRPASLRRRRS